MKITPAVILLLLLCFYGYGQVRPYHITAIDSSSKGYYFLSTTKSAFQKGINHNLILDSAGKVVFYQLFPQNQVAYDFKIQPNGLISYFQKNKYYLMDSTFKIVDSVWCKGYTTDLHELQILPNGHYLLLGSEVVTMDLSSYPMFRGDDSYGSKKAKVTSNVIQELDASKNVVFEWRAKDHLAFDGVDKYWLGDTTRVDWTHFNALELDKDGNILVSSRHFDQIIKIDHSTGNIIWRFGGKDNQFKYMNDAIPFYGQHDIRRIANGNITLFDNGHNFKTHGARALEYKLDETNKTADLVWSYTYDTAMYSNATGNVQRLPDGRTLVNFGLTNENLSCFTVVDSGGKKSFDIVFEDELFSYRSFNYFKLPWALHRPQITCFDSAGVAYLDAGPGHSFYKWSNGATTRRIVSKSDTFSVTVDYGAGYITSEKRFIDNAKNPCHLPCNATPSISGNFNSCKGSSQVYTDSVQAYSVSNWTIEGGIIQSGQGSNAVTVQWGSDSVGYLTVTEMNFHGCSGSIRKKISLTGTPASVITGPDTVCSGTAAAFKANGGGKYFLWEITDGNIVSGQGSDLADASWNYGGIGKITLIARSDAGCIDTTVKVLRVQPKPVVNLSGQSSICEGLSTVYSVLSHTGSNYVWRTDGGNILSGQGTSKVQVSWPASGNGKISVTEINSRGCSDSASSAVNINPLPKADFTSRDVFCLSETSIFNDNSTGGLDYVWKFGDGQESTDKNPSHNYAVAGIYNVSLTVRSATGCTASTSRNITIAEQPDPSWTAVDNGAWLSFKASDSLLTAYDWEFGDGSVAGGRTVTHTYDLPGSYKVSLTCQNSSGCVSSYDSVVVIEKKQGSGIDGVTGVKDKIFLYPNPANGNVMVTFSTTNPGTVLIEIHDLSGKVISGIWNAKMETGNHSLLVDTHSLLPGVYLVSLRSVDWFSENKLVIER